MLIITADGRRWLVLVLQVSLGHKVNSDAGWLFVHGNHAVHGFDAAVKLETDPRTGAVIPTVQSGTHEVQSLW